MEILLSCGAQGLMERDKFPYIDQRINLWIEKFPQLIDHSILRERNRLFAYYDSDFIQKRSPTYLLRILLSQHLQKKKLSGNFSFSQKNRSIEFRVIPGKVQYPFGSKRVLGVLVQISLSDRYELFDEENFRRSVYQLMPSLHMVKGTLFKFYENHSNVRTWYAEFEKTGNQPFTLAEVSLLKQSLGEALIERTERLVPYVF